jgi:hypothetical protein
MRFPDVSPARRLAGTRHSVSLFCGLPASAGSGSCSRACCALAADRAASNRRGEGPSRRPVICCSGHGERPPRSPRQQAPSTTRCGLAASWPGSGLAGSHVRSAARAAVTHPIHQFPQGPDRGAEARGHNAAAALSVVMRDCNLAPVFWEQSGSGQASADAARCGNAR